MHPTPTGACVSDKTDSSESWDWQREEGRERGAGLYLQSNFNGENGGKNNVKIKQNLQNRNKQDGEGGVGGHKQGRGRGQWMFTRKGKALQNKVHPRPTTRPEPLRMEIGEETGRKTSHLAPAQG